MLKNGQATAGTQWSNSWDQFKWLMQGKSIEDLCNMFEKIQDLKEYVDAYLDIAMDKQRDIATSQYDHRHKRIERKDLEMRPES